MSTGIIGGNVRALHLLQITLSPAAVLANTTTEQLFSFPNIPVLPANVNVASVSKPTAQAGLGIVGYRSTSTQLGITFSNNTGSSITPTASEIYNVLLVSPESGVLQTAISF